MKKNVLQELPAVDSESLYSFLRESSRRYKEFCALKAAVQVGLFDTLEHERSAVEVSRELKVQPSMTEDLCELLCDLGFLERSGRGYRNTAMSNAFVRERSHWYQGEVINNLHNSFRLWDGLDRVWKSGPQSCHESRFFAENNFIDSLKAEVLTGELQKTVAIVARLPGFSEAQRFLDLGGGHGLYSVAFCRVNPSLEATVFDFPEMEECADSVISEHHAHNVVFRAGNLFVDDFGQDYDIVFFSYNPMGKNPVVLKKIHRSLKPGGLFITKHAFYRSQEVSKSRLLDIEWSLSAFQGTPKGRNIYRFAGDLSYEEFLAFMQEHFDVLSIIEASEFAAPDLQKFGDRLDSKIIVGKKG